MTCFISIFVLCFLIIKFTLLAMSDDAKVQILGFYVSEFCAVLQRSCLVLYFNRQ